MYKLTLGIVARLVVCSSVHADTYVHGYTRKDGTQVQPHYRSDANDNRFDNYSTRGNTNPYTGQNGTIDPYKSGTNHRNSGSYNDNFNKLDD